MEVERLADHAERLFPTLDFGGKVRTYSRLYPAAAIRRALDRASSAGKPRWDYVLGILNKPQDEPVSPGRAAPSRPPGGPPPPSNVLVATGPPKRFRGQPAPTPKPNTTPDGAGR